MFVPLAEEKSSGRRLTSTRFRVKVLPATSTAEQILAHNPDGVFLSNGPGDPAALDYAVRSGKARYVGASSMWAWQFAKALHVADSHGWTRFVTMQNHYNLLYREEEREMLPLCSEEGIGVVPWSPLARGWLAGRCHGCA